jgi:hypothetical protein
MPGTPYDNMPMNEIMHQNTHGMDFAHSQQYFSHMNMPNHMGMVDENNPQFYHDPYSLNSHSSNSSAVDARRMSQPDLRVQTQLRPHTPAHQIQSGK